MVRTIAGVPLVGSPIRLDGERADSDLPPPALGEHTADVLASLGLESGEVERLRAAKIVG
jgi:crotonobetainyl-CoA:carnitine CoA-transferase CaiB-like acyl-CoA transferase